jgi:predicted GIY-YIG superfamily endonuclease
MPLPDRFTKASAEKIRDGVPQSAGVYELKSFGECVYVGSTNDLRERILVHYNEKDINGYRYETVGFLGQLTNKHRSLEQEHYDRHVDKHGEPPRWNDKRPNY